MSRLKFNEKEQNNAQLMQTAEQIHSKMTQESVLFATPVPGLSILEEALIEFRNSATEAAYRDKRAILIRNESRKELVYVLKELSKYVDTIANGDSTIILASGFALRKTDDSYKGLVPKSQRPIIKLHQIGSGRVSLRTKPWVGARMYCFQYRIKGSSEEWASQLSSKSSCIIERLEMFREYEFRVTYIGIDPRPNYSDSVSSYAL